MTWKNIILERVYANDNNKFAKNMVVVAIQSKEEGNVAAGMIEALKKNASKSGADMYKWRDSFEHPSNSILVKGRGITHHLNKKAESFREGNTITGSSLMKSRGIKTCNG